MFYDTSGFIKLYDPMLLKTFKLSVRFMIVGFTTGVVDIYNRESSRRPYRIFQKKFNYTAPSRQVIELCLKNFAKKESVYIEKNAGSDHVPAQFCTAGCFALQAC